MRQKIIFNTKKVCAICFRKFEKKGKYEKLCLRCWNRQRKIGSKNFKWYNSVKKLAEKHYLIGYLE